MFGKMLQIVPLLKGAAFLFFEWIWTVKIRPNSTFFECSIKAYYYCYEKYDCIIKVICWEYEGYEYYEIITSEPCWMI